MNTRRKLVLAAVAGGLARAGSAWAQAPARMAHIGWISIRPLSSLGRALFTEAMRERGWVEGTNYVLDALHYDGRAERIPALAAELVQRRPDVIVASGSTPVRPLMQATQTIPIVFLNAGDPMGAGFVSNLARPGGNLTGLGALASGLVAKQLDLLKVAVPRAQRIGLALNPHFRLHAMVLPELLAAAQRLGVELKQVTLRSPDELGPAFAALARERVDALLMLGQPFILGAPAPVAALTQEHRLPTVSHFVELTRAGVLMSYGSTFEDQMRRLPYYLDRILKGTPPGDLPVEQPTRFYLTLNLKTARALGLTLPQSLLLQATEVIE
ncbi:MAG: ABC transporter substrate-binding protein [Rubrivivax sp.]